MAGEVRHGRAGNVTASFGKERQARLAAARRGAFWFVKVSCGEVYL